MGSKSKGTAGSASTRSGTSRTTRSRVLVEDTKKRVLLGSKDLSTEEINFRLGLLQQNLQGVTAEIEGYTEELVKARDHAGELRNSISVLEGLVAQRAMTGLCG
jgi:archaellum component FlaC